MLKSGVVNKTRGRRYFVFNLCDFCIVAALITGLVIPGILLSTSGAYVFREAFQADQFCL